MVSVFSFLFVISSIGFATAAASQQESVTYVADFNYEPVTQAAPGSGGVTFAIGNVGYKADDKILWLAYPQFDNLGKAIKDDLSKLLLSKGFGVRGPFDSYDLIPYSDKKAIDLYLIPTFELSLTFKDKTTPGHSIGDIEVNGKMTLELREIVTRELMWTKSIPLTKFEFPYNVVVPDSARGQLYDIKPFIMNDLAKGVEKQYPNLMATIFKLIDPEEMRIIKKQCQELKSKKGY
jgi:hypothetical protein